MPRKNSLDSWIDSDRIREVLEEVRPGSTTRRETKAADPIEGDSANDDEREASPIEKLLPEEVNRHAFSKMPRLPLPEKPKKGAPVEQADSPAKGVNPLTLYFPPPSGNLDQRAQALITWVRETANASQTFIVDAYGATIAKGPETDDIFLASVSHLADALGRGKEHLSKEDQGALHVEMGNDYLCLVQAKWDVATVALGMIRKEMLARDLAIRYRQELTKIAQERRRERD